MNSRYTKAQLEELVCAQLENLNAMHDLLHIMKVQNGLIANTNKRLEKEMDEFRSKPHVKYVSRAAPRG